MTRFLSQSLSLKIKDFPLALNLPLSLLFCLFIFSSFSIAETATEGGAPEAAAATQEASPEATSETTDEATDESTDVTTSEADPEKKKEEVAEKESTEEEKTDTKPKTPERFSRMYAKFETTHGEFKALLHHTLTPVTVENFAGLAEGEKAWTHPQTRREVEGKPFYDGLTFHRIIRGFMIQGGDPLGNGRGGPGFRFQDEFVQELRHNKAGVLSMANAGPNTNGSQFFITLGPQPHLDDRHTVFGEVVEGMDVIEKIGNLPTNRLTDQPVQPVKIKKLTIIRE